MMQKQPKHSRNRKKQTHKNTVEVFLRDNNVIEFIETEISEGSHWDKRGGVFFSVVREKKLQV